MVLAGEDPSECGVDSWGHVYRGFHASADDNCLRIVCPFGSSAMESLLWELTRQPGLERMVLVGTAGALHGFAGPAMAPLLVASARPVNQCFESHPEAVFEPSWFPDVPPAASISTDRFYGFSDLIEGPYPAEPGLQEAWSRWRDADAMVEMEVAAFYHFAKQFGAPDLQYAAIKVVANDVADLDSLPASSRSAMETAIEAGQTALDS